MGQSQSVEQANVTNSSKADQSCSACYSRAVKSFTAAERAILQQNLEGGTTISSLLLIDAQDHAFGTLERILQFCASFPNSMSSSRPVTDNIVLALSVASGRYYDSKQEYLQTLFLALAIKTVSNETTSSLLDMSGIDMTGYYIAYDELLDFTSLLLALLHPDIANGKCAIGATKMSTRLAKQLWQDFSAPMITFELFAEFIKTFPKILDLLGLLYRYAFEPRPAEIRGLVPAVDGVGTELSMQLYMTTDIDISSLLPLYNGKTDGYSMSAFERKVFKWNAPTILLVSGSPLEHPSHELDNTLAPIRPKDQRTSHKCQFAAIVQTPWRTSSKRVFADDKTVMLELKPGLRKYSLREGEADHTAFFYPGVGIGIGYSPPQRGTSIYATKASNISLFIDSAFMSGSFRDLGPGGVFYPLKPHNDQFEERFMVRNIEVLGVGTKKHLNEQKKDWAWDDHAANGRRSVNVGEDRAILEMAGLVGQYNAERGCF